MWFRIGKGDRNYGMKVGFSQNIGNFFYRRGNVSFTGRILLHCVSELGTWLLSPVKPQYVKVGHDHILPLSSQFITLSSSCHSR